MTRYVDEQVFQFNNRKDMNDSNRFELAMRKTAGKRLTYANLTSKSTAPNHEATGPGQAIPF